MSKAGVHKPPGAGGKAEADSAEERAPGADFAMHEHIGRQLEFLFDEMASEPIPDKLRALLEKLERKETKS